MKRATVYTKWLDFLRGNWLESGILIFLVIVPLSQFLSARILVLLLVLSAAKWNISRLLYRAWDIILYFGILSIGMLYSEDFPMGIGVIETSLSLLVFSIVLSSLGEVSQLLLHRQFLAFLVGMCLGSMGCLIHACLEYVHSESSKVFLYYALTSFLDFQPTYYAYYLVFSITVGLYLLNYQKTNVTSLVIAFVVLFLFSVLLLTGGRTSFISMLLVFAFFVLKFFLEKSGRIQRATFGLVIVMMIGLFVTSAVVGESSLFSDSWDRYDLWKSAINANEDVLFGVGTGDYKSVLNAYFVSHGMPQYASENLNAHNQFIQSYLSNGILGLVAVLLLIGRPLYLAFRLDNTLTILVLFPFLIYGMTEVFLGRYQGVVFFAFLHQVFVSHLLTVAKPVYTRKPI